MTNEKYLDENELNKIIKSEVETFFSQQLRQQISQLKSENEKLKNENLELKNKIDNQCQITQSKENDSIIEELKKIQTQNTTSCTHIMSNLSHVENHLKNIYLVVGRMKMPKLL